MSTIRVNAVQDTSGVERYMARAWVNFNGTNTVAIRAAGNVTSITDNGTGDYTINFTNVMPDVNYSVSCITGKSLTAEVLSLNTANTENVATSGVRIRCTYQPSGVTYDSPVVCAHVFR